jgi:hypothetical protein
MTPEELRNVRFTWHAAEVMADRNVTQAQVADVLMHPEIVEPHRGKRRFIKGELVVVLADDDRRRGFYAIVTVLWRRPEAWTSADMRQR